MIPAYSELYVKNAREAVGTIFSYAINDLKLAPNWAAKIFTFSNISKMIEKGNPGILVAFSKEECAYLTLKEHYKNFKYPVFEANLKETKEFWSGSILALIQHQTGRTFKDILDHVSFRQLLNMYDECYLMERSAAVEEICNRYLKEEDVPTKLKTIRTQCGLSQSELADKSGVSLRMIQLYEQKVNLIDSASASTLCKLSIALDCDIKDLLEEIY